MSPPSSPATVPPSAAGSRARFPHLDALRGIAALSVAGFHFASEMPGTWFTALFSKGWLGVEVFFVISGFILPCALQARGSYSFPRHYPHFLWKRILRLHPPYLVTNNPALPSSVRRVPVRPSAARNAPSTAARAAKPAPRRLDSTPSRMLCAEPLVW